MTQQPPLSGPEAIQYALENLDLAALEAEQLKVIKDKKKTARSRAVRLLNILDGFKKNDIKPKDLMLNHVPVLPPTFRPFAITGDTFLPGDANELYRDLMEYRRLYSRTEQELGRAGAAEVYADMNQAVRAAFGYAESPNPKTKARAVKGFFETVTGSGPKSSFFQSKMLSKPVDTVGRGVIIPDADLGMDEVGLPEDMAWKLYGNYVQRHLVKGGMTPAAALRHIQDRTPQAKKALEVTFTDRPVVITRSPAWHKYNVIGQTPKLTSGDAIKINTFITEGQNADFDGDQCINQIFACIDAKDAQVLGMSYSNLRHHEVRFSASMRVPHIADSCCYIFDLADFPAGEMIASKMGEKGQIDFHNLSVPIRVLAYDELKKELVWAEVSNWSKHYDREVEIVDTHNGFQIVTDDDPRAVYGTAAGELSMRRFTPTEALANSVMIPRSAKLPEVEATTREVAGFATSKATISGLGNEPFYMRSNIPLTANVGWLLGAMAGDGWVVQNQGDIQGFAIADADGRNAARVTSILPEIFKKECPVPYAVASTVAQEGRFGETTSYRFRSVMAGQWFRYLLGGERDDTTAGSGNKHLPPFFLAAPEEFRSGLLAGLLDTDGSISVSQSKNKPQLMVSMGSTSLRLVQETRLLANSLGIRGRITPTRTPKGKDAWLLSFSNADVQKWGGDLMARRDKAERLTEVERIDDSPVTSKYDILPLPAPLAGALRDRVGCPKIRKEDRASVSPDVQEKKKRQSFYVALSQAGNREHPKFGALSRSSALEIVACVGEEIVKTLPQGAEWLNVVHNSDVTWERVVGVQKTGIRETGYDLTVPGYETFMSADGVILSNTMSVHVPSSPEAVKDVREKMMASKMLWSIKDRTKTLANPKHEQIVGLTLGQAPGGQKRRFASDEEAMQAIESGQIDMNDDIEIG